MAILGPIYQILVDSVWLLALGRGYQIWAVLLLEGLKYCRIRQIEPFFDRVISSRAALLIAIGSEIQLAGALICVLVVIALVIWSPINLNQLIFYRKCQYFDSEALWVKSMQKHSRFEIDLQLVICLWHSGNCFDRFKPIVYVMKKEKYCVVWLILGKVVIFWRDSVPINKCFAFQIDQLSHLFFYYCKHQQNYHLCHNQHKTHYPSYDQARFFSKYQFVTCTQIYFLDLKWFNLAFMLSQVFSRATGNHLSLLFIEWNSHQIPQSPLQFPYFQL